MIMIMLPVTATAATAAAAAVSVVGMMRPDKRRCGVDIVRVIVRVIVRGNWYRLLFNRAIHRNDANGSNHQRRLHRTNTG